MDTGFGTDIVTVKIRGSPSSSIGVSLDHRSEYLQTFIRFPQTLRIFFASKFKQITGYGILKSTCTAYDLSGYIPLLEELEKEQALGKLIRLFTPGDHDIEKPTFSLPRLHLGDLFITEQVLHITHAESPLVTNLNGGADPHSPLPRIIDPSLVCISDGLE